MDWYVLGIDPTKDKKAITAAYRQKLRQTNPEDKPEEFKALRAAYEEAMALADRDNSTPERDESPVGVWIEAVSDVYQNFSERIDPSRWEALVRSDVCVGLDTRPAAEDALLRFLMEHYYLPKSVWAVLDNAFHFSERAEELYEAYPRDFIDHAILTGLRMEPTLNYELFIPGVNGADCDAYRRVYFDAYHTEITQIEPLLAQMDTLSERHPCGDLLRFRFWIATGRSEEGKLGLRKLAEEYPTQDQLTLAWATVCLDDDQFAEVERITKQILAQNPNHIPAKNLLAQCLAKQGQYHDAKELVYEIAHASGNDPVRMEQLTQLLKQWNTQLITQREERYAACPDDTDNTIELAWCYMQNDRLEDAAKVAETIDSNAAEPFAYHNLMAKLLFHNPEKYEQTLHHLQVLEQLIRNMQPDGTRETEKRMNRLPEMLQLQGSCLAQMERNTEAREKFEAALEIAPDDPEVLILMGKILFATGDYAYAVEVLDHLVHVSPSSWFGESLLAFSLYRLHRDREAFDAANRALDLQGNDLSLYILKMQILIRNSVWDEVHGILDFLQEHGAPVDIATDYIMAQLSELEQKDTDKAFEQYQKIARQVEAGETLVWASELYYRMALLMSKHMDIRKKDDRDILIAQIDKGLKHNPQDMDCLSYKAWLLKKGGQLADAIEMYKKLEVRNPDSTVAQKGLAGLYYEDLGLYAQQSLSYYERLLEKQKTAEYYFYAATCKRHMGDLEGAGRYYRMELEMDPDDVDGYRGLAFLSDAQGDYEKSLEYLTQAISIMETYQREYMWLIEHKVQVLRRMGRHAQALALVDDTMKRYSYQAGFQLKFDICCQFGLWDQAKRVLDAWKQEKPNDHDVMAASGKLYLLTGKMFKAVLSMGSAKQKLPFEKVQDFRLQLADLECNHNRKVEIWSRRVKQDPQNDFALISLAQALWHSGKKDAARQTAQKALALLDNLLTQNLTDEALVRSRRCLALALLGRSDEASAELSRTRQLPLCHHCEYCGCKDADIYEAAIEEILGNREKALELYRAGKEIWPDDLDFAAGEARLTRKGKHKC